MTVFVQRQYTGWIAPGSSTDPVTYPPQSRIWDIRDVYPSNVMKIEDNQQASGRTVIAASGTQTIALPIAYSSADRLSLIFKSTQKFKIEAVIPVLGTTTITANIGTASDSYAVISFISRITSIVVTNVSSTTSATVDYFLFQVPDLSDSDSWLFGYQTTGVV